VRPSMRPPVRPSMRRPSMPTVRPSGATAVTARPPAAVPPVRIARGARRAAPRGPPVAVVDGRPPAGVGRPPGASWGEHGPRRPPRPFPQDPRPWPRPPWWPPRRPPGSRPPEGQGGLVALPELGPSGGRGPLAGLRARPGRRRLAAELRHEALVLLVQLARRAPLVRRHDPASRSLGARLSRGWVVARPAH